jgi:hypothetical protein
LSGSRLPNETPVEPPIRTRDPQVQVLGWLNPERPPRERQILPMRQAGDDDALVGLHAIPDTERELLDGRPPMVAWL